MVLALFHPPSPRNPPITLSELAYVAKGTDQSKAWFLNRQKSLKSYIENNLYESPGIEHIYNCENASFAKLSTGKELHELKQKWNMTWEKQKIYLNERDSMRRKLKNEREQ